MRRRHIWPLAAALLLSACGRSPAESLAARDATIRRTAAPPTALPGTRRVSTREEAITVAGSALPPAASQWQVIAVNETDGVWLVTFRRYEADTANRQGLEAYERLLLAVSVDAQTGLVLLRQSL